MKKLRQLTFCTRAIFTCFCPIRMHVRGSENAYTGTWGCVNTGTVYKMNWWAIGRIYASHADWIVFSIVNTGSIDWMSRRRSCGFNASIKFVACTWQYNLNIGYLISYSTHENLHWRYNIGTTAPIPLSFIRHLYQPKIPVLFTVTVRLCHSSPYTMTFSDLIDSKASLGPADAFLKLHFNVSPFLHISPLKHLHLIVTLFPTAIRSTSSKPNSSDIDSIVSLFIPATRAEILKVLASCRWNQLIHLKIQNLRTQQIKQTMSMASVNISWFKLREQT